MALLEQKRQDAHRKGFLSKKGFEPAEAGEHDVWLTYLYLKYASDLADGLSDLARADTKWQIRPEKFDPAGQLEEALENNRVEASLRELTPENPQYQALRQDARGVPRRRRQRAAGRPFPRPAKLAPGQRSRAVALIAQRLVGVRRLRRRRARADGAAVYSPDLQEAVKRFQRRHGLTDDGIVSAPVIAEMNVPIDQRISQIALNLERWRWLPRDLGERHILVNIPEYRLEVWERGPGAR